MKNIDKMSERELRNEVKIGRTHIRVRTRALKVACDFLNTYAGETEDRDQRNHILRARDQCLNAQHGVLSTDPFPNVAE